jgi:hypothetical protein
MPKLREQIPELLEQIPPLPKNWPLKTPINTGQAAQLLGLDPHTVSAKCSEGKMFIPCYKIGGKFVLDLEDVKAYLLKARIEPDPERAVGMR